MGENISKKMSAEAFILVKKEYEKYFTPEEWSVFEKKFAEFDQDKDGFLNREELKIAQQKMGKPKTHVELAEMIKTLASQPARGMSYRDFIRINLRAKDIDPDSASGGKLSTVPTLIETSFAECVTDFDVKKIKAMHEANISLEGAEDENVRRIREAAKARQLVKEQKAAAAAAAKKKAEQEAAEKAAKRASFKEKFAMFGN